MGLYGLLQGCFTFTFYHTYNTNILSITGITQSRMDDDHEREQFQATFLAFAYTE
jgi:hypothetical protein